MISSLCSTRSNGQQLASEHDYPRKCHVLVLSLPFLLMLVIVATAMGVTVKVPALHQDKSLLIGNAEQIGFIRQDVVYGLVHMAKTGGTTLVGELASHFERICGNKGNSFDYYQFNERAKALSANSTIPPHLREIEDDMVSKVLGPNWNRGRISFNMQAEIGFEDCDYISLETEADHWNKIANMFPLELHVPCRDPVDHLMSMFNYHKRKYNCRNKSNILRAIKRGMMAQQRFSDDLVNHPNITSMKCYDASKLQSYIDYMSNLLQRKRIETDYLFRRSNDPRNRSKECVWKDTALLDTIEKTLVDNFPYFAFCKRCLGSDDDILA